MKNPSYRLHSIGPGLALAFVAALALGSPSSVRAADAPEAKPMKEMSCCRDMREHGEKLMAEMKAQDAELAALVTQMNSAPEDKKLDLLAAIVTRLVDQRAAMNEKMAMMRDKTTKHMMAHFNAAKAGLPPCCEKPAMPEKD